LGVCRLGRSDRPNHGYGEMKWSDLSFACKLYLLAVYLIALPLTYAIFISHARYPATWAVLTLVSLLVSSAHLRLPRFPAVLVSMGDVFTIVVLITFGPGPALVNYWFNVTASTFTGHFRRHGWSFFRVLKVHRVLFNFACSAASV